MEMKWKMTYCFKAILVMQMLLLFGCNDDNSGSQFSNPGPECQLNDILLECKQGVLDGYTLYSPIHSTTTYLTDICGEVVHLWESDYTPAHSVYLLGNGHLMRPGSVGNVKFDNGGTGGIIEEFDWDGNLVWEYYYSSNKYCQHHDIEPLPNGNVLLIAWEQKAPEEIAAAGGNPDVFGQYGVWSDHIIEVEPILPRGGRIVWEWHLWDHLIQDYDPRKKNYGRVKDHPERLDINFADHIRDPDWSHMNSIDYNEELDQILLSVHTTCEILIIDHSTTTEEAAGHTGGRYGKGGDFLYRWGNPQIYRAGGEDKQYFFGQHDAHWIEDGLPQREAFGLQRRFQVEGDGFAGKMHERPGIWRKRVSDQSRQPFSSPRSAGHLGEAEVRRGFRRGFAHSEEREPQRGGEVGM